MRFILELDDGEVLTNTEQNALTYLLSDALSDFVKARSNGDAVQYVLDRYEAIDSGLFQKKVQEVKARVDLAKKLHNAALHVLARWRP